MHLLPRLLRLLLLRPPQQRPRLQLLRLLLRRRLLRPQLPPPPPLRLLHPQRPHLQQQPPRLCPTRATSHGCWSALRSFC